MPFYFLQEDVQLMVETGLEAYRFSISWSRLIPSKITHFKEIRTWAIFYSLLIVTVPSDGRGPVNPKGLAYYNNLINELISQG